MASSPEDQATHSALICATPGCGAELVATTSGARIVPVSFPDEPEGIAYLLGGGMGRLHCFQCDQDTPYQSCALCILLPLKKVLLFVEPRVLQQLPDLKERVLSSIAPTLQELGIEIALHQFTDTAQFRTALAAEIRQLVAKQLSEFSLARAGEPSDIERWLDKYDEQLNRTFFSAAWLLARGALPAQVLAGISRAEGDDSATVTEKEVLEELRRLLRELVVYRTMRLARVLVREGKVDKLEEAVAEALHPKVIDDETVKLVAAMVEVFEEKNDVPSVLKYAYEAVFAAICSFGGERNPRQSDWVGWYVAIEIAARDARSGNDVSSTLRVPLPFARQTITAEQVWDQVAPRLAGQDRSSAVDAEAVQVLIGLLADFDVPVGDWLARGVRLRLENASDETLDKLQDQVLHLVDTHKGIALPYVRMVLHSLFDASLERFMMLSQSASLGFLRAGDTRSATWTACYAASSLNRHSLCTLAWDALQRCSAGLSEQGLWPPSEADTYAAFLTEEGNCLRYLGRPQEALAKYERCRELVSTDTALPSVRVNERNRAIVLRELGKVEESRKVLEALLPHSQGAEKAQILMSLAATHRAANRARLAAAQLGQALSEVSRGRMNEELRSQLLLANAAMARESGRFDDALALAYEALQLKHAASFYSQAIISGIGADAAEELDLAPEQRSKMNELATQVLEGAVEAGKALRPAREVAFQLRTLLAERYNAAGRAGDAERLLMETASDDQLAGLEQSWKLWAKLAEHAVNRGDQVVARDRLRTAFRAVIERVSSTAGESDLVSAMIDKDPLQKQMAHVYLDAHARGEVDGADLRVVADLQTSIMLWHRMSRPTRSAESRGSHDTIWAFDEAVLQKLLAGPSGSGVLGILQSLESVREVTLLLTVISRDKITTTVLPIRYPSISLTKLRQRLLFHIEQWSPARQGDPLMAFEEWRNLAESLRTVLAQTLLPGAALCIVPGATLSGLPLHAALSGLYPCSYAPSLRIACVLRERRLALPKGGLWRPESILDFVVWKHGERPEVIAEFQHASAELKRELQPLGVRVEQVVGSSATREQLLRYLGTVDCARLSCHGFASPTDLRFQLLVADGKQLPPAHPGALASESGRRFLVNWDDLAGLEKCPAVTFSTACASGLASGIRGGERIGIERALFTAGGCAYVAPQWSVPVSMIQPVVHRVIAKYLGDRTRTLSDIVAGEVKAATDAGIPSWVAQSLAVYGDWL